MKYVEVVIVVVLVYVAVVGVPIPAPRAPVIPDSPSGDLLSKVAPVAVALAGATEADRAVWAAAWEHAATVAETEGTTDVPVLTNSRELRAWTVMTMDVAWRRLGGVKPGAYPDLQAAIEAFLADPAVMGKDDVPLDEAGKARYAAACRALAYAGRRRG